MEGEVLRNVSFRRNLDELSLSERGSVSVSPRKNRIEIHGVDHMDRELFRAEMMEFGTVLSISTISRQGGVAVTFVEEVDARCAAQVRLLFLYLTCCRS
jgi:hypothetical protein